MQNNLLTGKEINDIKNLFKEETSVPDIANKLNRTNRCIENVLVTELLINVSDCKYGGY